MLSIRLDHPNPNELNAMREDVCFIDVIVTCGEMMFSAHKVILAVNSPYLKRRLLTESGNQLSLPTEKEKVQLKFNPLAVMTLLQFMYTKKLTFKYENAADVLSAIKFLEMDGIVDECLAKIESLISKSIENFIYLWDLVETYGSASRQNKLRDYLGINFKNLVETDAFLELSEERLLILLVDERVQEHIVEVVTCIFKWVNYDKDNRLRHLNAFFAVIDISKLPQNWLVYFIENEPLIASTQLLISVWKTICGNLWPREKLLVFLNIVEKTPKSSAIKLNFLNPSTEAWLECQSTLPEMNCEDVICVGSKLYFVEMKSINAYNIETDSSKNIVAELMSYEKGVGKLFAFNDCLYYLKNDGMEKYNLNEEDRSWVALPPIPHSPSHSTIIEVNGLVYFIDFDLLVQIFNPASLSWEVFDFSVYATKFQEEPFTSCRVKDKIYLYRNCDPSGFIVIQTVNLSVAEKKLITDCPLESVIWMSVEELDEGKISVLMVDSIGTRWKYKEMKIRKQPVGMMESNASKRKVETATGSQTPHNPFWYAVPFRQKSPGLVNAKPYRSDIILQKKPAISFTRTLQQLSVMQKKPAAAKAGSDCQLKETPPVSPLKPDGQSPAGSANEQESLFSFAANEDRSPANFQNSSPKSHHLKTVEDPLPIDPKRQCQIPNGPEDKEEELPLASGSKLVEAEPSDNVRAATASPVAVLSLDGHPVSQPVTVSQSHDPSSAYNTFSFSHLPTPTRTTSSYDATKPLFSLGLCSKDANDGIPETHPPLPNFSQTTGTLFKRRTKAKLSANRWKGFGYSRNSFSNSKSDKDLQRMSKIRRFVISYRERKPVAGESSDGRPKATFPAVRAVRVSLGYGDDSDEDDDDSQLKTTRNAMVGTGTGHGMRFYSVTKGTRGVCEHALITKGDDNNNIMCSLVNYSKVFFCQVNVSGLLN